MATLSATTAASLLLGLMAIAPQSGQGPTPPRRRAPRGGQDHGRADQANPLPAHTPRKTDRS